MKCLIVEDEAMAAEALADLLREEGAGQLEIVGVAKTAKEADRLVFERAPEAIFVDIGLPGLSGIEFAGRLTGNPIIVFVTACEDYAIAAFELGAVDYILKPYDRSRLKLTLSRILGNHLPSRASQVTRRLKDVATIDNSLRWIYVRDNGAISPVAVSSIVRIQAMDGYACLITDRCREYLIDVSLNFLERRLQDLDFLRISRACIANAAHVSKFRGHPDRRLRVSFSDGAVIVASRQFSTRFRANSRKSNWQKMASRTA